MKRAQIAQFLMAMRDHGFDLHNRRHNCLWLPAEECLSLTTGHALHRGPHPHYTDVVAGRVERIRQRWRGPDHDDGHSSITRLVRLQATLTHVLSGPGPRLLQLNRRDPMRAFADYAYLDDAITRLFAAPAEGAASTGSTAANGA